MNILGWTMGLALLPVVVAVFILRRKLREQQQQILAMEGKVQALTSSLNALCSSAVGVDRRVVRLERTNRDLEHRQETLESQDAPDRPYGEAIQLVQQGAGARRLVEELEMSPSEAELLVALHGHRKAG
jgi:predicted membrane metal-binding protein